MAGSVGSSSSELDVKSGAMDLSTLTGKLTVGDCSSAARFILDGGDKSLFVGTARLLSSSEDDDELSDDDELLEFFALYQLGSTDTGR